MANTKGRANQVNGSQISGDLILKTLHKNLDFAANEQYKLLRTNLSFTLPMDEKCHIVGVTSSIRGEGKSTTAINLSYVLAENDKNVLLIDGDLRLPSVAKKMGLKSSPGLTNFLKNDNECSLEQLRSDIFDNWHIMPSGPLPPNPSELLGSDRMGELIGHLRNFYDFIVIDLPPVNIVSDALTISKYVSGMIVVVREEYTEKKSFNNCIRQLKLSNVKVLGCVMNETSGGKGSYSKYKHGKYYRYYKNYRSHYGDYYQGTPNEDEKK